MRKVFKIFIASFTALILSVLSSCWLDPTEPGILFYDSIEDFVVDFGTKIEKQDDSDACCLFEYDAIKASVEKNLSCDIEFERCKAYVISSGGDLKPQRYEYRNFQYVYGLKSKESLLGEILFDTTPKRCYYELKHDVIRSVLIDEIKVDFSFEKRREEDCWFATIYIEEEIINQIVIFLFNEELKKSFSVELFVDIIKQLLKSTYIIR